MRYWIGLFLLASGRVSLVFNEFTVQVRRIWPWRRDDADQVRDAALNQYYRFSVYAGSVAQIEIGVYLTGITLPPLALRILVYLGVGAWSLWKRQARRRDAHPSRAGR